MNNKVIARVRCEIEVNAGAWPRGPVDFCKLTEQARQEGLRLVKLIAENNNAKVVGEPKVNFVLLEEYE